MKALFLFLLAIFLLYSCKKEELKVCFSYTNDSIFVGDTVFFTNCTSESGTYFWDFGDSLSSADENPYHIFQHTGEYSVTLTVNAMNQQNTVTKKIVVNERNITVCFSYSPDSIYENDTVFFQNCTNGTGVYLWDFGDSLSSADENPYHIFQHPGEYNVTLTVNAMNQQNTITKKIVVIERNINVCFSYSPDLNYENDTVFFQNCTNETGLYLWDFGDNQYSSEQNPSHLYSQPGNYEVKLEVTTYGQSFSASKSISILPELIDYSELIISYDVPVGELIAVNQSCNASEYESTPSIKLDLDNDSKYDIELYASSSTQHFSSYAFDGFKFLSQKFSANFISVWDKTAKYSVRYITDDGDTVQYNHYETFYPNIVYPPDVILDSSINSYPAIHYAGDLLKKELIWQNSPGTLVSIQDYDTWDVMHIVQGLWISTRGFLGIKLNDGNRTRFGWIEISTNATPYAGSWIYVHSYYLQK